MINKNPPLRIAIAGLGFGENVHIPASLSNKNIELVGLWHPRPERLKEACHKYQLRAYESWKDLGNVARVIPDGRRESSWVLLESRMFAIWGL